MKTFREWAKENHQDELVEWNPLQAVGQWGRNALAAGTMATALTFGGGAVNAAERLPEKTPVVLNKSIPGNETTVVKTGNTITINLPVSGGSLGQAKQMTHQKANQFKSIVEQKYGLRLTYTNSAFNGRRAVYTFTIDGTATPSGKVTGSVTPTPNKVLKSQKGTIDDD